MSAFSKHSEMIVHSEDPWNAEPPRELLAHGPITGIDRFYVRNHGQVPELTAAAWRLEVGGMVHRELELGLEELRSGRFPEYEVTATLQCAGNRRTGLLGVRDIPGEEPWGPGATGTAVWTGVRLADVLAAAEPRAAARHVAMVGADVSEEAEPTQPFASSVPLDKALRPEVLLAYAMDGEPLAAVHGAPVRVVVPGYIGARSVKWLTRIELREDPWPGWFQDVVYRLLEPEQEPAHGRGFALGEVALNSEVLLPGDGAQLAAGTVRLTGYAFAGGDRSVARVDVSGDGARTWTTADLGQDQGRWAWRLWHAELQLAPDEHELVCRAWDSAGALQSERAEPLWNPKGYVNNAWGRVTVTAR